MSTVAANLTGTTAAPPTTQEETAVHALTKITVEPFECMGLAHKGPYHLIGKKFKELWKLLHPEAQGCAATEYLHGDCIGLFLDNPEATSAEELRSFAAVKMTDKNLANIHKDKLETVHVAGGIAAVMAVLGSYE